MRFRSRDGRRSPEWRWQGRDKATNRTPGVKGVLKNRIEIEVPGSQTSCNRLIPYPLYRAEGIPETVYRSLCFYVAGSFNPDKLEAHPPGSVVVLPGNTSHFHWAKSSEYVTQVTAIGSLGFEYVSSNDDPRNRNS
jgi:hypothetical protein